MSFQVSSTPWILRVLNSTSLNLKESKLIFLKVKNFFKTILTQPPLLLP